MSSEVDKACEHAYQLLKDHVERYRTDIHVSSIEWRSRCKELAENLDWILFCRDHRLPAAPKPRHPNPPPPPRFRR